MPRLSVADCEALLRMSEEGPSQRPNDLRAVARLRQCLKEARQGGSAPATTVAPVYEKAGPQNTVRSSVLHVCTSCRAPGSPREPREERPGFKLYHALCARVRESPLGHRVEVRPAECLSLCPRPCAIALSSPGAWSYLFGDQHPGQTADAIVECVSLYVRTTDGFMPRDRRPKPLRASILGRVPPREGER
ncbi:MAG: DUF1636 domain-containing protein [Myxococcota bacterium]